MKLTKKQLRYIISESLKDEYTEDDIREAAFLPGQALVEIGGAAQLTAAALRQFWPPVMALFKKYLVMRNANVRHSDKYFHCLAHSEAVKASLLGELTSEVLGRWREQTDVLRKGDPPEAVAADYFANNLGRISGKVKGNGSACWKLIPNGLPEEYWVLPAGLSIDVARKYIEKNTEQNEKFMLLQGDIRRAETAANDQSLQEPYNPKK
jgi:hypothetical protein